MILKHRKLVYGVGINDADYTTQAVIDGVSAACPFYSRWTGMLKRCYSEKELKRNPSYSECSVSEDWHTFNIFKSWMEEQDWEGKQLDKDLLITGNKIYSPESCVFIGVDVNTFIAEKRGSLPFGVSYHKRDKVFQSGIKVGGKRVFLGNYKSPEEAHQAWKEAKYKQAVQLASEQADLRVAAALIERYKL